MKHLVLFILAGLKLVTAENSSMTVFPTRLIAEIFERNPMTFSDYNKKRL